MNRVPPPLDAFPLLDGARVDAWLGRGYAAESWRLKTDVGLVVLRRDLPVAARLGLDRANEWNVLNHVADAGLAPEPLAADPGRGLLVTRWHTAPAWRPSDLREARSVRALGRLLRRVHGLAAVGKPFRPAAIARTYAKTAPSTSTRQRLREVEALAAEHYPAGAGGCLCHHDAHAGNVLGRRSPVLLDWEYAAVGPPWMDLAVVMRFHRLGVRRTGWLVEGWCAGDAPRRSPEPAPEWAGMGEAEALERVRAFAKLYDHLAALWAGVVESGRPGGHGQA